MSVELPPSTSPRATLTQVIAPAEQQAARVVPSRPTGVLAKSVVGVRCVWRLLRLAALLVRGSAIAYSGRRRDDEAIRHRMVEWTSSVCAVLGVNPEMGSATSPLPTLYVANHVSWLDPLVLAGRLRCPFVAKGELRRWPVVGRMIAASGGIFIERDDLNGLTETVRLVCRRLAQGESVCVFPEVGMSDGTGVHAFTSAVFQAAIDAHRPVVPVALAYFDAGQVSMQHAWGKEPFARSFWRVLRSPECQSAVRVGESIEVGSQGRQELARRAHQACAAMLRRLQGRPDDEATAVVDDVPCGEDALNRLMTLAKDGHLNDVVGRSTLQEFGFDSLALLALTLHVDVPTVLQARLTLQSTVADAVRFLEDPLKTSRSTRFSAQQLEFAEHAEAIERLRYEVYIAEQHKRYAGADHTLRRLTDIHDVNAAHFGLFHHTSLVGCGRLHLDAASAGVGHPTLQRWLAEATWSERPIAMVSRVMLAKSVRQSDGLIVLLGAMCDYLQRAGVRHVVCHANPKLARRYGHFGFRECGLSFEDEEVGPQVVLRFELPGGPR